MGISFKGAYEGVFNPFKSVVDDSKSANPAQAFLDPGNLFGGLINGMPGLAPLPKMPSWAVKYLAFPTTKTNFGAFPTKSMQDTPNSVHASIWERPGANPPPVTTPTVPTNPGGNAPVQPVNPGGPGIGVQPQSRIFNSADPTNALAAHYASTPNAVVSQSAMRAPIVAGPVSRVGPSAPVMAR